MLGKVIYQGGHSFLFSGSQMVHFVTEKQNEGQPPGGGGTLTFSYIHRLGPFFEFKILNFNILGGFKKITFWGYEDFVDIFWGHHKIGLYLGSFLCFSLGQGTEWGIFFGAAKISNIFWGCLKFQILFG